MITFQSNLKIKEKGREGGSEGLVSLPHVNPGFRFLNFPHLIQTTNLCGKYCYLPSTSEDTHLVVELVFKHKVLPPSVSVSPKNDTYPGCSFCYQKRKSLLF